ncbi:hypothetical protein AM493_10725 [Flavobacterium akiainvivens]|uniref:Uncharacterized protein n=1 Tax=Flavobacterium akiainvivens TaxID=1202724 RepID=A0A0N0RQR0_9FLAO|nr:hypothetical protein [Flavobacterium akiainvivens]KOS06456.1 hypothetical protein AM493_10725 [Flavobacterium akiainvivens]SFQ13123.1 hypothetical protein SAMN05444144_101217 [Flavobacterium akiainvivens]
MKYLTRLRPLLLVMAAFLFVQCQDEYLETNPQTTLLTNKARHRILTGHEAQQKRDELKWY